MASFSSCLIYIFYFSIATRQQQKEAERNEAFEIPEECRKYKDAIKNPKCPKLTWLARMGGAQPVPFEAVNDINGIIEPTF